MLRLSLSTFRERWQLFIGAIVTVCLGVALVQSSLLLLIASATHEVPASLPPLARARLTETYEASLALLGVTLGFSAFLAVFIVSSTFAFTVAQRRQDLALLRLVGGSRRHVRRLLLSEALLLGLIGTALGIPVGLLVMDVQTGLLTSLHLLPADFSAGWEAWILGVSFGVGIGVSLAGVFFASRRAARIRALEALRDSGEAARVMTPTRWVFGLLFLAGALSMVIVAPFAGPEGAMALSINAALAASVGLATLSPLVVPLVARLFGFLLRGNTLAGLAEANLRDGVRRSAATAAPLLVLVALLIAQIGAQASIGAAIRDEQARTTRADLVVSSPSPSAADRIASIPGVASASVERSVPVTVTHSNIAELDQSDPEDMEELEVDEQLTSALAVDASAYRRTHLQEPESGSLDDLRSNTVALGAGYDGEESYEVGDTVAAHIAGQDLSLRVVAVMPDGMAGGPQYLVPSSLLTAQPGAVTTFIQLAPGSSASDVSAALRSAGVGDVSTAEAWLAQTSAKQQDTQNSISLVVMGLCGIYALIAVINAVVIAAADRRREFATARVSGLARGQVVRSALIESWAVTAIGLLLGCLASLLTLIGATAATARINGAAHLDLPLGTIAAVVIGAFAVVGLASVWTTLSATRPRPITLIGARE